MRLPLRGMSWFAIRRGHMPRTWLRARQHHAELHSWMVRYYYRIGVEAMRAGTATRWRG